MPVVNWPGSSKKLSKRDAHKFVTEDVIASCVRAMRCRLDWTDEQIKKNESLNPVMVEYYRDHGLLARSAHQLFRPARLVARRQDRDHVAGHDAGELRFRPRQQFAGQLRSAKLFWVAGEYMKAAPLERKIDGVIPILQRARFARRRR